MKSQFICSLVIFFLIPIIVKSQELQIKVQNPVIRQNQEISINFEFQFFEKYLQKQFDKSFSISNSKKNDLITEIIAKDTGLLQIGPFEFVFDSIKYITNIAKVKVLPPIEPKIGTYINFFRFDNRNIVLIEQIFEVEYSKENNNKSTSNKTLNLSNLVSVGTYIVNNTLYIEPSLPILEEIKIKNNNNLIYYSRRSSEIVNNTGNKFVLTKDYFKNLPSDYDLPIIEIE